MGDAVKLARTAAPGSLTQDLARNRVVEKVNRLPLGGADARTLTSETFTAGQTRDIAHGLGRAAVGFLAVNARTSAPLLYRGTAPSETTSIRLTHSGAGTTLVDLVVW